jgi:hypothetical protein
MCRLTRFVARSASVAALLALLLAAAAPAHAGCVTPSGTIDSIALSSDGSLRAFTGNVSPFGEIAGILEIQANPTTGAFTGQFVFVARGGTVYGTIKGQFIGATPTTMTYVERLTLTGGTGIYTGITGYADPVLGMLNLTDGTGHDMILGGQICLPGSHH